MAGDDHRARVLANLLWLPALSVGALQMLGVQAGALTSYGADLFAPIALYASFRSNGTLLKWFMKQPLRPAVAAAVVISGCVAWELCQRYDFRNTPLAITHGRFDPLDIVAYVMGVGIAFTMDVLWMRRSVDVSRGADSIAVIKEIR
jgi:hypothetical protein